MRNETYLTSEAPARKLKAGSVPATFILVIACFLAVGGGFALWRGEDWLGVGLYALALTIGVIWYFNLDYDNFLMDSPERIHRYISLDITDTFERIRNLKMHDDTRHQLMVTGACRWFEKVARTMGKHQVNDADEVAAYIAQAVKRSALPRTPD